MKGLDLEDFENVVEVDNNISQVNRSNIDNTNKTEVINGSNKTLKQAAAENFENILELAGNVIEIKRMKVASEAVLAKMEADRKQLLSEAEVYVQKKNADTKSIVDRMNVIRYMMQDFYQQSNQQITGTDFREIITSIVDQMGRIDNGKL